MSHCSWRESARKAESKNEGNGRNLDCCGKNIRNRRRNVWEGRNFPFGRNNWFSAVSVKTLLSFLQFSLGSYMPLGYSPPGLWSFLSQSLPRFPPPYSLLLQWPYLKCSLQRQSLRLLRRVSLYQPQHIIDFCSLLYFHHRHWESLTVTLQS